MLHKQRLSVAFAGVAAAGVPRAATVVVVAPSNGMVKTVVAAVVTALVHGGQDVNSPTGIAAVIVPLVAPLPTRGQVFHGRMHSISHVDLSLLNSRMAVEISPHQVAVPSPVVLGIGRRVDTHKTTATANVAFEGPLLVRSQYIAGRIEKNHRPVRCQSLVGKTPRVLGGLDGETVFPPQGLDSGNTVGNGIVAETSGFGKDQNGYMLIVKGFCKNLPTKSDEQ